MKTVLVLFAAVLLSVSAFANETKKNEKNTKTNATETVQAVNAVSLSGLVIDHKSNEQLAGATILIDGNKYYSDLDGNFAIANVKPGKYTVRVELISYQPTEMEVEVKDNREIKIGLVQE